MDLKKKKITISWSGGKDSAFALFKILLGGDCEVVGLHTVINEETRRVGMHGVHEALMDRQAEAIGLSLTKLYLESSESHSAYNKLMSDFYRRCANEKLEAVVFGDIFLEDLKQFREDLLTSSGLNGIYPLWKIDTNILIEDFINIGFKTIVCAINASLLSENQLGKTINLDYISELSERVDPCGENGEFHTFVYDGPIFKHPVKFRLGEIVKRTYTYQKINEKGIVEKTETAFLFQDLIP